MLASEETLNKRWFQPVPSGGGSVRYSVERFARSQLRRGSMYSRGRALIPVVALGWTWLVIAHAASLGTFQDILQLSVTLRHLLLAASAVAVWNLALFLAPSGIASPQREVAREPIRLIASAAAASACLLLGHIILNEAQKGLRLSAQLFLALLIAAACLLLCFFILAAIAPRLLRRKSALIIGTGDRAQSLKKRLDSQSSPFDFYGFLDDEYCGDPEGSASYLGGLENLPELLKLHPIEVVLISLPLKSKYAEIQRAVDICDTIGVESHFMRDVFATSRMKVQLADGHHFSLKDKTWRDSHQVLKRGIDLVLAIILLVLFGPLMGLIAVAVKLCSHGPIIFAQQRYGRNRKRFLMYKFRSMVSDAEQRQTSLESQNEAQGPVFKIKKDPRVTPFGSFIRKTSMDELPQLLNVLKGDMSLVGPRPLPLRDVTRFQEPWLLRRFHVRPGLTCLWQVSGRSNMDFDDWIKLDLEYIDNWSLGLDAQILFRTIPAVLRARGAS